MSETNWQERAEKAEREAAVMREALSKLNGYRNQMANALNWFGSAINQASVKSAASAFWDADNAFGKTFMEALSSDVGRDYVHKKELSLVQAQASAMREALQSLKHVDGCYCEAAFGMGDGSHPSHSNECQKAIVALSADAGRGYVHKDELTRAQQAQAALAARLQSHYTHQSDGIAAVREALKLSRDLPLTSS